MERVFVRYLGCGHKAWVDCTDLLQLNVCIKLPWHDWPVWQALQVLVLAAMLVLEQRFEKHTTARDQHAQSGTAECWGSGEQNRMIV